MKKETSKKKRKGIGNRRFLINKKGSAFALGMVITVFILIGFTWHGFILANNKIDTGINSLENLSEIYKTGDRFSFYIHESVKLSAHQSFYGLSQDTGIDKDEQGGVCFAELYQNKNTIVWDENCMPKQNLIKQKFLSDYDDCIGGFLENYPEKTSIETASTMTEDIVETTVKTTISKKQGAAYAVYNLSYGLNKNFILNLTSEQIYPGDFSDIYDKTSLKLKECNAKKEEKNLKICLEELTFERWDFEVVNLNSWILFEFSTKKPFFFKDEAGTEQFEKIPFSFGLRTS